MKLWGILCGILVLYLPILYYTIQFLAAEFNTKVTRVLDPGRYHVHQIFIPFGPTPPEWEKCSLSWDVYEVTRWNKGMCNSVIMKAMPSRRELLDYEGVMFTDVCRAAIMYVHGGMYADMDICANKDFTFPECEACFFKTSVGVSNDLMIAEKKHPVFLNILQQYADYAWVNSWFYLPYIQEMYSTGPVRFTLSTHGYPNTKIIPYSNVHITHIHGNSWHSWDAVFFMHPWILLIIPIGYCIYRRKKKDVILGKNI